MGDRVCAGLGLAFRCSLYMGIWVFTSLPYGLFLLQIQPTFAVELPVLLHMLLMRPLMHES